ncbi:MAG: pyridoxal phosphate-dependent aminotransferase [Oscillospiraceae bacterium]|jgi:cystathionine beta-lyase|nr:pyridoxal phosphate-dependent aminotransferase [Oscillospiraceae bacterium]
MSVNFDHVPDRTGTNSLKFDFAAERGRPDGLLSLWVADMDFPAPPEVLAAVEHCVRHGIFGYTEPKGDYYAALSDWFGARFGYPIEPEWVVKTPGVVVALALAVKAYTLPGDAVLVQRPVYYCLPEVIADNERVVVSSALVERGGRYEMDFADMEKQIALHNIKLFLLCSPHNPVGRVWTRTELLRVAEICEKHDVIVVSDEIHADFAFAHPHTLFSTLSPATAMRTVLCTSAAKSFNIAGLQCSNIVIENPDLRAKFKHQVDAMGYSQLNTLGLAATQAAYAHGAPWLDAVRTYIVENITFLREFLARELPQVRLVEPEGTYLAWLDFRALGFADSRSLNEFIVQKARLWIDAGTLFGPEGLGFQRINVACPRAYLTQALERLREAVNAR